MTGSALKKEKPVAGRFGLYGGRYVPETLMAALEEREREYLGDLLVQPRNTKEIRAYVLADYLLGRHNTLSEELYQQRVRMYRSATRTSLLTGLVTGTTLALAYVFVAIQGSKGLIDPGGVVLVIGIFGPSNRDLDSDDGH